LSFNCNNSNYVIISF